MSPIAKQTSFTTAVAILGNRLLALPLAQLWRTFSTSS
jgi:hypothetical protein